jgi:hypothetical protein
VTVGFSFQQELSNKDKHFYGSVVYWRENADQDQSFSLCTSLDEVFAESSGICDFLHRASSTLGGTCKYIRQISHRFYCVQTLCIDTQQKQFCTTTYNLINCFSFKSNVPDKRGCRTYRNPENKQWITSEDILRKLTSKIYLIAEYSAIKSNIPKAWNSTLLHNAVLKRKPD